MTMVKLPLDLTRQAARTAMRAYLDALDHHDLVDFAQGYRRGYKVGFDAARASIGPTETTGGEQPAGEEAEAPPPAGVADTSFSPARRKPTEGRAARDVEPFDGARVPAEADVPGEALPRCGGTEGAGAAHPEARA